QSSGNLTPILIEHGEEEHRLSTLQPFGEKRSRAVEIGLFAVELAVAVEEGSQRLQMLVRRLNDMRRAVCCLWHAQCLPTTMLAQLVTDGSVHRRWASRMIQIAPCALAHHDSASDSKMPRSAPIDSSLCPACGILKGALASGQKRTRSDR